jgi:hypothetical protein
MFNVYHSSIIVLLLTKESMGFVRDISPAHMARLRTFFGPKDETRRTGAWEPTSLLKSTERAEELLVCEAGAKAAAEAAKAVKRKSCMVSYSRLDAI